MWVCQTTKILSTISFLLHWSEVKRETRCSFCPPKCLVSQEHQTCVTHNSNNTKLHTTLGSLTVSVWFSEILWERSLKDSMLWKACPTEERWQESPQGRAQQAPSGWSSSASEVISAAQEILIVQRCVLMSQTFFRSFLSPDHSSLPTSGTPCQSLPLLDFWTSIYPSGQDCGKMALAWPSFSVCIWSLRNSCIFVVPNSRSKKKKKSTGIFHHHPAFLLCSFCVLDLTYSIQLAEGHILYPSFILAV